MVSRFLQLLPLLGMELAVGVIGFALSFGWTYRVNQAFDPDTVTFLAKTWLGLTAIFVASAFIFSNP